MSFPKFHSGKDVTTEQLQKLGLHTPVKSMRFNFVANEMTTVEVYSYTTQEQANSLLEMLSEYVLLPKPGPGQAYKLVQIDGDAGDGHPT